MSLGFKCKCCEKLCVSSVKVILGKEEQEGYCRNCSKEHKCKTCGRRFVPKDFPDTIFDYESFRYFCNEDCYQARPVECARCGKKIPVKDSFKLKGSYYCSEKCRDTLVCTSCHREYSRKDAYSEKFCCSLCELGYWNITRDASDHKK